MGDAGRWLFAAAVCGFAAVGLGAFGAHGLKDVLDAYGEGIWETATLYLMFHTGALGLCGLVAESDPHPAFRMAGAMFVVGNLFFSGSLYLLALTGSRWLAAVTPVGGVAYLAGWFALGVGLLARRP